METFDLTNERDRLALAARVFVYPPGPHRRKHGPTGYTDYESYRDWLRDEFSYRCVFSLFRETWPQTRFHIDHLVSQNERPDLVCNNDNLILLEARLNLVKGKRHVPDPCKVALDKCLLVHTGGDQMGCIEARDGNKIGEQIIRMLRLDSDDATQIRRDWIGILRYIPPVFLCVSTRLPMFRFVTMSPFMARNVSLTKGAAVRSWPAVPKGASDWAYSILSPNPRPSPKASMICFFRYETQSTIR